MSYICNIPTFENQFLLEQNRLRALHGCPALKISRKLTEYAKEWVKILVDKNELKHRKQTKYGENIYTARGKYVSGKIVAQHWYDEMKKYNFNKGEYSESTRNFTQMIWKNTTEFGIAMEEKKCIIWIVAYYKSAGNYEDEFIKNVPPIIEKIKCIVIAPFERQCLLEHNRFRELHGCPPLVINSQLCLCAREWAKKLAQLNTIQQNKDVNFGENIFVTKRCNIDGIMPVKCWYSEIKDYSFLKGKYSESTGHFTQLMWKNTTDLGVGMERRGTTIWVVAYYKPPGNYRNEFIQNVPPKIKSCA